MEFKINNKDIPVTPKSFQVTNLDLDDGKSTVRSVDGTMHRDRIAVKRQIEIEWGLLRWNQIAELLQMMSDVFFSLYYPDPTEGKYITKTFYVGNRPCPVAFERDEQVLWKGLKVTLTEK